ncbi:F-box/kelch-repeat protein, partial [Trifolium medium]|nr:F-box/kelch-repeat protein [Trifolium medium]
AVKFDIEKFDGRINFDLWKVHVKDVPIQSGLHKACCKCGKSVHVKRVEQYLKKTLRQVLATSPLFWEMIVILSRR